MLNQNKTITAGRYRQQLYKLKRELYQKQPPIASKRRKVIFLHNNARLHVALLVKQMLLELEWNGMLIALRIFSKHCYM